MNNVEYVDIVTPLGKCLLLLIGLGLGLGLDDFVIKCLPVPVNQ